VTSVARLGAMMAFCVALGFASAAPAQRAAYERMFAWERENDARSRLTLYAELETLDLPMPGRDALEGIRAAAKRPFIAPSPKANEMAKLVDAWEPAFKLLYEGWNRKETGGYERTKAADPDFALEKLPIACAILACRSQAHAKRGDWDAALGDAATIWLTGKSLEAKAPSFWCAYVGSQLRGMGLLQLRAIVEGRGAELGEERIARLLNALQSHPARGRSAALVIRDEMNLAYSFLRSEQPKHAPDIDLSRKELFDALEQLARREGRLEAFPGIAREAAAIYPPLENFPIPNAQEAILREIWADALENVLVATLWTLSANAASPDGPASPEAIIAFAGDEAARTRLVDPFTGQALRIDNPGGGALTVAAAGPDGVIEPELIRELDIAEGLDAKGDVVVRLPWGGWHASLGRGRELEAGDIPRGSSPF
jgi:hypothetical protein